MASFNLDNYEIVKARKIRFYETFPNGCINVEPMQIDRIEEYSMFKATVWAEKDDTRPRGVGFAFEYRAKEKSKTKSGKEYESINYTSWVENCEESAVGRALDNAGFASNLKCSKEEIEKASRMKEVIDSQTNTKYITQAQREGLGTHASMHKWEPESCRDYMVSRFGIDDSRKLNQEQYKQMWADIEKD